MVMTVVRIAFAHQPADDVFVPCVSARELDEFDATRLRGEPSPDRDAAVRAGDVEHQIVVMAPGAHHVARDAFCEADHIGLAAGIDDLVMAVAPAMDIYVVTQSAVQPVVAAKAEEHFVGSAAIQHIVMPRADQPIGAGVSSTIRRKLVAAVAPAASLAFTSIVYSPASALPGVR